MQRKKEKQVLPSSTQTTFFDRRIEKKKKEKIQIEREIFDHTINWNGRRIPHSNKKDNFLGE